MHTQATIADVPLVTGEDGKQRMRFFWIDAYEGEAHLAGTIFLFGKVWLVDCY